MKILKNVISKYQCELQESAGFVIEQFLYSKSRPVQKISYLKVDAVLGVVAHTCNPSTQETEAGESLWVRGQPGLQGEFQDNQACYTEKSCLEKQNKTKIDAV